ncbi:hypothetical protein [Flammeovirga kamogawensis]|uniref:Uncharacterized protein n=1 Tax=Flammeovirga kamogawensis TaxID=373891 RepID=A0ABX8GWY7_9BACT|nr:hypothetical protein [Flammeovirga kamogawensis]MBB6461288.1 hypothetical protein [Flammeovirga kamogawensis]QWG07847.1 hypothetical protein KM029_02580 [Flammeovirga kamogawensis]TRX69652.1 hypothetical protein EO216_16515 [Flammeovirga kamogawensis]
MRRLILISLFTLLGMQVQAQSQTALISNSFAQLKATATQHIAGLIANSGIEEAQTLGHLSMNQEMFIEKPQLGDINCLVSEIQNLMQHNDGVEFKSIELQTVQTSFIEGKETIQYIPGARISIKNFVSNCLKKYYK